MMQSETEMQTDERHQEYLALINMIGFAIGISESLKSNSAAAILDAARDVLLTELQDDMNVVMSKDKLLHLAAASAGRC